MNLIYFTNLAKLIYLSMRILERFTVKDRKHTQNMRIYSKIFTSILGRVDASGRLITYILNSYFHHNKRVLMCNFNLYDACYHLKMKFSSI